MPELVETVRDEIKAQLEAVTGIGKVYPYKRHVTDEATFKAKFVDANNVINTVWFTRVAGPEVGGEGPVGSRDEANLLVWSQRDESWQIEFFYGFHDSDVVATASDTAFQILIDRIQTKFRFLQDLNGKAYQSDPLQLVSAGLWQFLGGTYFTHRAEFRLPVRLRIENTNVS